MIAQIGLNINFYGSQLKTTFWNLFTSGILAMDNPIDYLSLDFEELSEKELSAKQISSLLDSSKKELLVNWREESDSTDLLEFNVNSMVRLKSKKDYNLDLQTFTQAVSKVNFEIFSFGITHLDLNWIEYDSVDIGEDGNPPGFAVGFKGLGHDRLVSRRWLDFGPWWTIKGPNDTSIVLFHDPDADAETALEQAKLGHQRMGITDEGGLLLPIYNPKHTIKGLYCEKDKGLKITVNGRKVTQREMLDVASLRYQYSHKHDFSEIQKIAEERGFEFTSDDSNSLDPNTPVEKILYVFIDENEAREHLHELWLREIECWTYVNGLKTRLDLDYNPTPNKPDWVKKCEERYPEL